MTPDTSLWQISANIDYFFSISGNFEIFIGKSLKSCRIVPDRNVNVCRKSKLALKNLPVDLKLGVVRV